MTDNRIRQAIDSNLSTVHVSQGVTDQIINSVTEGKKVKRKLSVGLIFMLILLLAAMTALAASVVSGYISFLNAKNYPTSAVEISDTLYLMTNQGLMSWSKAEEDAEMEMSTQALQASDVSIHSLLFADNGLMMLDMENEKIWAYNDGMLTMVLDYHETGVDFEGNHIESVVYQDGVLFLLTQNVVETKLYRWDIHSNTLETMPTQGMMSIAEYKQSTLLGIQRNFDVGDSLVAIDIRSGNVSTLTTLPLLGVSGIAYSKKPDAIYAMVGGSLQCFNGTDWQIVRERSIPANSFYFAVLDNGYVAVSQNGAQYVTFDGAESGDQIHIAGYLATANITSNVDNDFEATHLGTTVIRQTSPHYCAAEILEAIQNGENIDLFHVRLDAGILSLIENRTLAGIDTDSSLTETCSALLSQITDAVFYQGVLYAVPSEIYVQTWEATAQKDARTIELSELLLENAAIESALTDTAWCREDYVRYLLEQTIMIHKENLDFMSDDFLSYLELLKAADLRKWPIHPSNTDYIASVSYLLNGMPDATYPMLPPRLSTQDDPQVSARLMVYVLNPNSQNKEGAIEYLSYIASYYDQTTVALLSPDQATRTLFPFFQQVIDEENASRNPLVTLTETIKNDPTSWLITDNALAFYRDVLSPHLNLKLESLLADTHAYHDTSFSDMVDAVLSYLNGSGTAEECAIKLNDLAN